MIEDIDPGKVWQALLDDPRAQLCDVRTDAEWDQIGIPDLQAAGRAPVLISWQLFPTMQRNEQFLDQLAEAGLEKEMPIYFLCRSGVRSLAAAEAARAAGYREVYNVADGFEGPPDASGQRGTVAGWQAAGLPWRQR
ncbi:rhodanese-like domain-containing protein [Acidisoma sp. 7E03]